MMKRFSKLAIMMLSLTAMPAVAQIETYDETEIPLGLLEQTEEEDAWDKYLISDEDANMADKDPYTSDELFEQRIDAIAGSDIMKFEFNEIVKGYIERYTKKMRGTVAKMLGKYNLYGAIFDDILGREDIPDALRYLPVIESGLNAKAKSPAGAGGLWQFMPSVAKSYDLQVNSWVDERSDPYKGTVAAAKLLKSLYNKYGDWNLVLAAYNCGAGNVNKAIARSGGKRGYWEIYSYLPRETRGYVPAFIAAVYVMNYYTQHNIKAARIENPTKYDSAVVHYDLKMEDIARELSIDLGEVRDLNPQYKSTFIPGARRKCTIILPFDKIEDFAGKEHDIALGRKHGGAETEPDALPDQADIDVSVTEQTQTEQTPVVPQRTQSGNVTEVDDDDDDDVVANPVAIPTRGSKTTSATNSTRPQSRYDRPTNTTTTTTPATPTPAPSTKSSTTTKATTPVVPATPAKTQSTRQTRSQATTQSSTKTTQSNTKTTQSNTKTTQETTTKGKTSTTGKTSSTTQETTTKSKSYSTGKSTSQTQKTQATTAKSSKNTTANNTKAKTQPKAPAKPASKEVTVKSGDNLSKIAAANGLTVSELRKQNPNIKGDKIMPGDQIKVKSAPSTSSAKSATTSKTTTKATTTSKSSAKTTTAKKRK